MSEEEAMMQAIAMSLAVEETGLEGTGTTAPAPAPPPEKPAIEFITEDKLWSFGLYKASRGRSLCGVQDWRSLGCDHGEKGRPIPVRYHLTYPTTGATDCKAPGWLTPLILLLDMHEKMATIVQRRNGLPKVEHVWQYYEDRHNRWATYHQTSNNTIEKAYLAGESEVCYSSGRRHYLVLFNTMTQINEDNGTPRAVMRIPKPDTSPTTASTSSTTSETAPKSSESGKHPAPPKDTDPSSSLSPPAALFKPFGEEQVSSLIV
eukprot:sb/3468412/